MAEAARNLSCVGADPIAVTDNLNFGSPENSKAEFEKLIFGRIKNGLLNKSIKVILPLPT